MQVGTACKMHPAGHAIVPSIISAPGDGRTPGAFWFAARSNYLRYVKEPFGQGGTVVRGLWSVKFREANFNFSVIHRLWQVGWRQTDHRQ